MVDEAILEYDSRQDLEVRHLRYVILLPTSHGKLPFRLSHSRTPQGRRAIPVRMAAIQSGKKKTFGPAAELMLPCIGIETDKRARLILTA